MTFYELVNKLINFVSFFQNYCAIPTYITVTEKEMASWLISKNNISFNSVIL